MTDYLVIYEDEDDGSGDQDELVLDVHTLRQAFRQHMDVETAIAVDVDNTSSRVGLVGLLLALVGAVCGLAAIILFAATYPQEWVDGQQIIGATLRRTVAALYALSGLTLVAGTTLTAYGRRVTARGRLADAHIVEKAATGHADLR